MNALAPLPGGADLVLFDGAIDATIRIDVASPSQVARAVRALWLTRAFDTCEIAALLGLREAEVADTLARRVLGPSRRAVRILDIQALCARHYGLAHADITSARRSTELLRPRWVAMYLARRLTSHSSATIGRCFGGRDHSTVLHAVRKIEGLCTTDDTTRDEVARLRRMLEET